MRINATKSKYIILLMSNDFNNQVKLNVLIFIKEHQKMTVFNPTHFLIHILTT